MLALDATQWAALWYLGGMISGFLLCLVWLMIVAEQVGVMTMTYTFGAMLVNAGALDTAKYRYAVYHGHAYDVIKRIKKTEIRSWNAENDEYWESVEYICY